MFSITKNMSRLKKKLLLYFLLIAIVSISVSAEIILELGSPAFKGSFLQGLEQEITKEFGAEAAEKFMSEGLDQSNLFYAVHDLQIRMILLLVVISAAIFGAFQLFTKDIVAPMEGMVTATKRISEGDLSATVPVVSQDEIGQIGSLINDMSVNLQDLILQIKGELTRLREKIVVIDQRLTGSIQEGEINDAILKKKIKVSDVRFMLETSQELSKMLNSMQTDLSALQAFVNLYKVFSIEEEQAAGQSKTSQSGSSAGNP